MFALVIALLATIVLTPDAVAQNSSSKYTVWSSVIFSRTGERTPIILGDLPTTLTSLGAQEQYANGQFFRTRYLTSFGSTLGTYSAPIQGIQVDNIDSLELYVNALDYQFNVASAQAFLQGLYPPLNVSVNASQIGNVLGGTSKLANGSLVESPLGGYQYAQIHANDEFDSEFPYLGGTLDCPAFDIAAIEYANTSQFGLIEAESRQVYQDIGPPLLQEVLEDPATWDYFNAYAIFDYLNYQNVHNVSINSILSSSAYINPNTNISYLNTLRYLADQQQYAQLANLYATNNFSQESFPDVTGSISTIAGNLLAAKLLAQLQVAAETGGVYYKLSLLFGDFEPLMSLFALLGLPALDSDFYGLPSFASVAVFDLFSWTDPDSTSTTWPSVDELYVRFWFSNGTVGDDFRAYSIFNNGPDQPDMTWNDFQNAMYEILIGDVGDWCQQCGSANIFCAAWNVELQQTPSSSTSTSPSHDKVSPAVAGVIGAIVTLVLAGLIFGLVMLIGGVRLHRVRGRKSELGGFKGSQKLASDKDLTIPKGGAVVGASIEQPGSPVTGGHERVGSWELKPNEADMPNIVAPEARRPSFEDDDIGASPFRDPVKPDERV